ncbi:hypothetical protein VN97_g6417 [Penicillium thymicola]|uniref:Secreted protein n=1 Tax=Penicillium thymicola TaxID=293382 RepID=A0AAI9TGX4_PENTH|nr:hypothetical protein VN97_g6417 [Penicillium thymicola]
MILIISPLFLPPAVPVFLQALDFPNDLCYHLFPKFELTASHFTPVNFSPFQSITSIARANIRRQYVFQI